jgi:hypothetical protein
MKSENDYGQRYRICKNVIIQRDIRIPENKKIIDCIIHLLNNGIIKAFNDNIMIISVRKEIMELNVVGAILLEELESEQEYKKIISKLGFLFGHNTAIDVSKYFSRLIELGVIEKYI